MNEMVAKAYLFAQKKHAGQMRRFTGEEYFVHPVAVSKIVEDLTKDPLLIQVALLHDVVEDTDTTIEEVRKEFGKTVAELVDQLTETEEKRGNLTKIEYLTREMDKMSPAALTVKLADRLDNIQFMKNDYKDKSYLTFGEWYFKQTALVIWNLHKNRNSLVGLTSIQIILVNMIFADLGYISIKYGWEK